MADTSTDIAHPLDQSGSVEGLLRDGLRDPDTAWSVGSFGAIAEFMRDPEEDAVVLRDGRLGLATRRGGVSQSRQACATKTNSSWIINHFENSICLTDLNDRNHDSIAVFET